MSQQSPSVNQLHQELRKLKKIIIAARLLKDLVKSTGIPEGTLLYYLDGYHSNVDKMQFIMEKGKALITNAEMKTA